MGEGDSGSAFLVVELFLFVLSKTALTGSAEDKTTLRSASESSLRGKGSVLVG